MRPRCCSRARSLRGTDHGDLSTCVSFRRCGGSGDAARSARRKLFQTICAICHDFDGRAWITGEDDGLNNLGAIASADPWRALHKMANGQTYADMPALRGLGEQTLRDLLAYLQTLPKENLEP